MTSLRPDIVCARQAFSRAVECLSSDPAERATIAAQAAFELITLDAGIDAAVAAFEAAPSRPVDVWHG